MLFPILMFNSTGKCHRNSDDDVVFNAGNDDNDDVNDNNDRDADDVYCCC